MGRISTSKIALEHSSVCFLGLMLRNKSIPSMMHHGIPWLRFTSGFDSLLMKLRRTALPRCHSAPSGEAKIRGIVVIEKANASLIIAALPAKSQNT